METPYPPFLRDFLSRSCEECTLDYNWTAKPQDRILIAQYSPEAGFFFEEKLHAVCKRSYLLFAFQEEFLSMGSDACLDLTKITTDTDATKTFTVVSAGVSKVFRVIEGLLKGRSHGIK